MNSYIDHMVTNDAHIFEISNSPYDALFHTKSIFFESNKKKIGIIDQFNNKRPCILNNEFLIEKKKLTFAFVATLLLDSHIVDALHKYVTSIDTLDLDTRAVTGDFLKHVSKLRCDYSPMFYLAENFAKSSKEQFLKTSSDKLTSIIKLHSMDEEIFISTGKISPKRDAIEYYYDLYKAKSLDECGINYAKEYYEKSYLKKHAEVTLLSYACLLKMVLIHFMDPTLTSKNIIQKYKIFEDFLVNTLGLYLAREVNLSLYYFSGLAGKFVNVQPNMTSEKAKKNLLATAWDLLLLRLPEFLLTPTNLPEVNMGYIVTSEDKLLSVAELFKLEAIFYEDKTSTGSPLLSFKLELFDNILSSSDFKELRAHNKKMFESRLNTQAQRIITQPSLKLVIQDLEHQLNNLCR